MPGWIRRLVGGTQGLGGGGGEVVVDGRTICGDGELHLCENAVRFEHLSEAPRRMLLQGGTWSLYSQAKEVLGAEPSYVFSDVFEPVGSGRLSVGQWRYGIALYKKRIRISGVEPGKPFVSLASYDLPRTAGVVYSETLYPSPPYAVNPSTLQPLPHFAAKPYVDPVVSKYVFFRVTADENGEAVVDILDDPSFGQLIGASQLSDPGDVFDYYVSGEMGEDFRLVRVGQGMVIVMYGTERHTVHGRAFLRKYYASDPNGAYIPLPFRLPADDAKGFFFTAFVRRMNYNGGRADRIGVVDSETGNGYGVAQTHDNLFYVEKRSNWHGSVITSRNLFRGTFYDWYIMTMLWQRNGSITGTLCRENVLYRRDCVTINTADSSYSQFDSMYILGGYEYWVDVIAVSHYYGGRIEDEENVLWVPYIELGENIESIVVLSNSASWFYLETGDGRLLGPYAMGEKITPQETMTGVGVYVPLGKKWGNLENQSVATDILVAIKTVG